jgi:hypothetical protein
MGYIFVTVKEYLDSGAELDFGQKIFVKKQNKHDFIGIFYDKNKNKLTIKSNNNTIIKSQEECYLKFNIIKIKRQ